MLKVLFNAGFVVTTHHINLQSAERLEAVERNIINVIGRSLDKLTYAPTIQEL